MRFFANSAQVVTAPSTPLEMSTPWLVADVPYVHYAQNSDTMYLVHGSYVPYKLQRISSTLFVLNPVVFIRGPFLSSNVANVTITPSADTGVGVTLTATVPAWGGSTVYIPGDFVTNAGTMYLCKISHTSGTFATDLAAGKWVAKDFFQTGHIGSSWRIKNGVVLITAYTSKTVVTGDVQKEPAGTAGNLGTGPASTADWAEGAFSSVRGWPSTVTFHQQRLFYGCTTNQPQTFWGSSIGAYDNFNVGSTSDSDAVSFTLSSDQVLEIRWMRSTYNSLQIGTSGGTATITGASGNSTITPTSINVQLDTDYGSSKRMAKKSSSYVIYLQSNGYQVRELVYDYYVNRQVAGDLNLLAEHILRDGSGAVDYDRQQSPDTRLWMVRSDGQIAVLDRDREQKVMGWSRITGGLSSGQDGTFEIITILQSDNNDDQIWVIVNRVINGSVKRYVEYFSSEMFDDPWDPVRVDCSLTYDSPKTISGITAANPAVFTATSHGFADGDYVKIDNIKSTGTMETINNKFYIVSDKGTHTFKLKDENGDYVSLLSLGTYISGGEARKMVTNITGLDHLEGEDVTVVCDGSLPSAQQIYTVSGGEIDLVNKAAVVIVGLPYTGKGKLLYQSDGAEGSAQTLPRRIYLATARLFKSLGFKIGQDFDHLETNYFVSPNQTLGQSPSLLTGDVELHFESWWDKQIQVCFEQDDPLPLHIESLVLRSEVESK